MRAFDLKTKWNRFLAFCEQPFSLLAAGIAGGLVGTVLYRPVLLICCICVLLAFHKHGSVRGKLLRVQIPWYMGLFVVSAVTSYWIAGQLDRASKKYIDELATAISNKLKPLFAKQPTGPEFSVIVEYTFFSGSVEGVSTPFWVARGPANKCTVSPARIAFFIRIKNMRPAPTMITAYVIRAGEKPFLRLKTATDPVVLIYSKGTYKGGNVEKTVQITQGTGQASYVHFPIKDADLKHAFPIEITTLDQQVGDRVIEPSKSIRGLAFFQYPFEGYFFDPKELVADITDDAGKTTSYPVELRNGDPNADTMPRTVAIKNPIDLSTCSIPTLLHPGGKQLPEPNLQFEDRYETPGMELISNVWKSNGNNLPISNYQGLLIPVRNDSVPGKVVGLAQKIKAQVILSINGQEGSHSLAPWQDERSNTVDIPIGETKFVVVAAMPLLRGKGFPLGPWQMCTSDSTQQGDTILRWGVGVPSSTSEQFKNPDKLERKLEIRLVSEDGRTLQTRIYDWKLVETMPGVSFGWFLTKRP
jgi:hypothetical protein